MTDFYFDEMLSKVYSWWPSIIELSGNSGNINIDLERVEGLYESQISPSAQASGSKLLIQLDWIIYGAVCAALKISSVVRLNELRIDYIKGRFHGLLLTVGVRQLNGEEEPDGSFDMVELAVYLTRNGLT